MKTIGLILGVVVLVFSMLVVVSGCSAGSQPTATPTPAPILAPVPAPTATVTPIVEPTAIPMPISTPTPTPTPTAMPTSTELFSQTSVQIVELISGAVYNPEIEVKPWVWRSGDEPEVWGKGFEPGSIIRLFLIRSGDMDEEKNFLPLHISEVIRIDEIGSFRVFVARWDIFSLQRQIKDGDQYYLVAKYSRSRVYLASTLVLFRK